jgi:Tfp pilus assembly protein PilX
MNLFSTRNKKKSRGFTLLLAALVSSIVLSLGASIFLLAKKEVTLSSLGRDSQYAFYTADQAAECALYWDARWNYFATSTPSNVNLANLKCDGQCLNTVSGACADVPGRSSTYPYQMVFTYSPTSAGASYCATVTVTKSQTSNIVKTTIHADGYSTDCNTLSSNPRALQRSVELHY